MRLLLLSNSTNYGSGYLDHAAGEIADHFAGVGRILFVPFALHDQQGYWEIARRRFAAFGIEVDRLERGADAPAAVENAAGIFVGGGNTFRLLDLLQRARVVEPIRRRVAGGTPYLGSSAGTVVASPTIRTTNDMPIVFPASFDALGLVPFQINCHYLDPDPASRHMGETRERRLLEFLEDNDAVVIGLREGAMLRVVGPAGGGALEVELRGTAGARLFRRGAAPTEHRPGAAFGGMLTPR
jgi:dipeptidase E